MREYLLDETNKILHLKSIVIKFKNGGENHYLICVKMNEKWYSIYNDDDIVETTLEEIITKNEVKGAFLLYE